MFNPIRHFKYTNSNKMIDGNSIFAPFECKAFCYSKLFLPYYLFAVKPSFQFPMTTDMETPDKLFCKKIQLKRLPGPPDKDGYYIYVLE